MESLVFKIPENPIVIRCVGDLLTNVPKDGPWYARGQHDEHLGVVPTIARKMQFAGKYVDSFTLEQERELLHRFRRHTYEHRGRVLDKWEAMFLARHHGLPVRLLDWTTNPLVSLYWACLDSNPDIQGRTWFFTRREK